MLGPIKTNRAVLVLALIVFSSCAFGSELNKSVAEFSKINMRVGGSINLVPSDEYRVSLIVSDGIPDDVEVVVRKRTLELRRNCGIRIRCSGPFPQVEGTIYYKSLDALAIDGFGRMTAKDLSSSRLQIDIRGTGELDFGAVSAENFAMTISGAGTFLAEQAEFADFSAKVRGVGDIEFGRLHSEKVDIDISGAGEFLTKQTESEDFSATIRGVGDVEIEEGTTTTTSVKVAGGGTFDGLEFESEVADVTIAGTGEVAIHASNTLDVLINGLGTVIYDGDPEVSSEVNGLGDIESR